MAQVKPLPVDILNHLAGQLGDLLPCAFPDADLKRGPIRLAETFPVWVMDAAAVTRLDEPFGKLVRQTGLWHHQVRIAGQAVAWARSMPLGPAAESWDVTEVFNGPLAGQVDSAIDWMDQQVPDEREVRFLDVPAYLTHAFWVVDPKDDQVCVITGPAESHDFQTRKLYPARQFLEELAKLRPLPTHRDR